jgi:nucleoside 2-deoxyribosyltransferase
MAFRDASKLTAQLLRAGLKVYSPIAHTHPVAIYGELDPLDHGIWLPFDAAIMDKADALLVAHMDTWDKSFGIAHEINVFKAADKPIYHLDPDSLTLLDA